MRTGTSLGFALLLLGRPAVADTSSGGIRGQVTDAETLEPLVGARVVVTSPSLPGERSTMTAENGGFLLTQLPPGVYSARFSFATVVEELEGIVVRAGRCTVVNIQLSGAHIQLETEHPFFAVDGGTGIGTYLNSATLDPLPFRTRELAGAFELVATVFPSPNLITIDGLNVSDPAFRTPGARSILEWTAELDLREAGWSAELDRSAGGLYNVVLESGGNRLSGSVFSTIRPGALAGDRRYVPTPGAWLVGRSTPALYGVTGFELGGALVTDRLWFHLGYAPEILLQRWTRRIRRGYAGDDLTGDPSDGGPNGGPDGLRLDAWGRPVTRPIRGANTELDSLAVAHHFHGKLSHRINDNHHHSLSLFGAPTTFDGVVENPFDPRSPYVSVNGDEDSFSFDGFTGHLSGVYNYSGRFLNDRLAVEAMVGWHHQERRYSLGRETADPSIVYTQPRGLAAVEAAPGECAAGDLFDDGSERCMVAGYTVGGSPLDSELLDRWAERVTVARRFQLAGTHETRVGLDFEQTRFKSRRQIPGGGTYQYDRSTARFTGTELYRDGTRADPFTTRTSSLDVAAFLRDTWMPAPELTVEAGLRWSGQQLYAPASDDRRTLERVLGIYDGFGPRIGAAWDFLGAGRSRLFAHWGRTTVPISLRVADRTFGGVDTRAVAYDSSTCTDETGAPVASASVVHPAHQCALASRSTASLAGAAAPGLEAEQTDELLTGVEIAPWPSWSFTVSGIYRSLGQAVVELAGVPGPALVNPGELRRDQLDQRIARARDAKERAALVALRTRVDELPRAERDLWGARLEVSKRSANFGLRGSYFLSWTHGNIIDLEPVYDAMVNARGPLPTDRRHRFVVHGFYVFDLRDSSNIPLVNTVGASMRLASGAPIDVLALDPATGAYVHLLPRGEGGRTPWIGSLDLHLASRVHLDAHLALELFVEIYNLLNLRRAIAVQSVYTFDEVEPIPGGTERDLTHARNIDGEPVEPSPEYGEPLVFQEPFAASVGVRLLF